MTVRKSKVIRYGSDAELSIVEPIKSAKLFVPEWYKKMATYIDDSKLRIRPEKYGGSNTTIKQCVPFLDSLTCGYIVELFQDVEVCNVNGEVSITWGVDPAALDSRDPKMVQGFPVPEGHNPTNFVWNNQVSLQTPHGYSCLITHPFNRFDLPFTTLTGVVDTDTNPMNKGKLPFYLKKDFEGIIPRGTPIYQILPFKRENWKSKKDEEMHSLAAALTDKARSVGQGFYKKTGWSRKVYE
jgi:hypothetical protein